jgi:peptidoglycan/LPS O-acetylase OafA/YrhL
MNRAGAWLYRRLSRVTSSGRFVPQIDGARTVAILSVVLFHLYPLFFSRNFNQSPRPGEARE